MMIVSALHTMGFELPIKVKYPYYLEMAIKSLSGMTYASRKFGLTQCINNHTFHKDIPSRSLMVVLYISLMWGSRSIVLSEVSSTMVANKSIHIVLGLD